MTLTQRLIAVIQAIASDVKALAGRLAVIEANGREVFVDETPAGTTPAIAFTKIPGTNTYKFQVRA